MSPGNQGVFQLLKEEFQPAIAREDWNTYGSLVMHQINHHFGHASRIQVSQVVYVDYHSNGLTSLPVRKDHKVLEIRQANESDIRDLADLDNECFDTYYYNKTKFSESDFQAYLCRRKSILLAAVRDSCLVGYVAGTLRISRFRSIAHLDSIAVSPTARNEGIGGRLLDLFIQGAKQQACQIVLLEVAEANKEGLDFFSKRGFQRIGDLPEYYGRGLDGVLMQLSI